MIILFLQKVDKLLFESPIFGLMFANQLTLQQLEPLVVNLLLLLEGGLEVFSDNGDNLIGDLGYFGGDQISLSSYFYAYMISY